MSNTLTPDERRLVAAKLREHRETVEVLTAAAITYAVDKWEDFCEHVNMDSPETKNRHGWTFMFMCLMAEMARTKALEPSPVRMPQTRPEHV